MYQITYRMLIGTARRDASDASTALSEVLAIKLVGGSDIFVSDREGRAITQKTLKERSAADGRH